MRHLKPWRARYAVRGDYIPADLSFHATILDASGNQFLRNMQVAMSAILRVSFQISTKRQGGTAHSLPMHEALCVAIELGDEDAAEQAARQLIEQSESDLFEGLGIRVTD